MSCDEIRYWLAELKRQGWGTRALGRTVGLAIATSLHRKINGKEWIYAGEQARASKQIERILAGELIELPAIHGGWHRRKGGAQLAEHPVRLVPPTKLTYDLKRGRLRVVSRL